eukprot:1821383-Rhodomonas_salina.1
MGWTKSASPPRPPPGWRPMATLTTAPVEMLKGALTAAALPDVNWSCRLEPWLTTPRVLNVAMPATNGTSTSPLSASEEPGLESSDAMTD